MSDTMDGVDAAAAELDGEEDQAEGAAPDDPAEEEMLAGRYNPEAAQVIEAVLSGDPLSNRELLRAFLEAIAGRPSAADLRTDFSFTFHMLVRRRAAMRKHGAWTWIPEDVRAEVVTSKARKPLHLATLTLAYKGLIWPPLDEPCGQLLDAGEGQARMWIRCARSGCHRREEVLFYLPGLDEAERAALAPAEVARRWACPACADFLRRQDLTREQRAAESQAIRALQRPLPSPSVISTLLRRKTAEGDALARDQLRIHRESLDEESFARMMVLVFIELDQMAPTKRSPGATAQHRARIGAFRLFAGWPAPSPSPARRRRPAPPPPPVPSPERRSP